MSHAVFDNAVGQTGRDPNLPPSNLCPYNIIMSHYNPARLLHQLLKGKDGQNRKLLRRIAYGKPPPFSVSEAVFVLRTVRTHRDVSDCYLNRAEIHEVPIKYFI